MKVKLAALVVALFVGCGSLMGNKSAASPEPPQRLTITRHGTLLKWTDGISLNAPLTKDGFELKYKTKGVVTMVSAKGNTTHSLLAQFAMAAHQENSARSLVLTADKRLQITSDFRFDESMGMLMIKRKFSNISDQPLDLQITKSYLDRRILFKREPLHVRGNPIFTPRTVHAGLTTDAACINVLSQDDMSSILRCMPPPVCPWNPPCPKNFSPYFSGQGNHPEMRNTITWTEKITLHPRQNNSIGGEAVMVVFIK